MSTQKVFVLEGYDSSLRERFVVSIHETKEGAELAKHEQEPDHWTTYWVYDEELKR